MPVTPSDINSPVAKQRRDAYRGSPDARCRLACEVAAAIREVWPQDYPLVLRLSLNAWRPDGEQVQDALFLAGRLKELDVDAIDCSTGGISGRERPQGMTLGHGYQLPLTARVRKAAALPTIGVGLMWDPRRVEQSPEQDQMDLVALGCELLDDPNWTLHAAREPGWTTTTRCGRRSSAGGSRSGVRAVRELGLRRPRPTRTPPRAPRRGPAPRPAPTTGPSRGGPSPDC